MLFWGGGRQLFVPLFKFRGEVLRTTQPPGSANPLLRHKRGRTPNFTLQALPRPAASGVRELASSRPSPAGRPEGKAAGGTAGTTRPLLTNQLPPPARHSQGSAGAQPAPKAGVAAVHALQRLTKKPSKTKPQQNPQPNKQKNGTSTEIPGVRKKGAEELALSAILEA